MELPLLERARSGDDAFPLVVAVDAGDGLMASLCGVGAGIALPAPPKEGEQYRFHFDMTKCIGCKCCVVACNEQNGNPAAIQWRRVGEIEGGVYPHAVRHYLSMGCNHCMEPTCLTGCPVDAYTKDGVTGIVRHSADACIGCQYCTWNCSYGVPQYNPERGVVGKCDMCYGRLAQGQLPACVNACPEGAFLIETVNTAEWRREYEVKANSPGMPPADDSLSTTRITLSPRLTPDVRKVDMNRLRPEHPHWPLVVMTVLTQLSVGAFAAIWLLELVSARAHRAAAIVALAVAMLALGASTLHLGRPIHAVRALKMWRRSWLSREVLLFTLFALAAQGYALALWLGLHGSRLLGGLTVLFGLCGVGASARLYVVPGRPAWRSPFTILEFVLTVALLGSAGANVLYGAPGPARAAMAAAAVSVFVCGAAKMIWLARSPMHERRGTFMLLMSDLSNLLALRAALLVAGLLLLVMASAGGSAVAVAMVALFAGGEFVGRYLFFVSVVPANMATEYLSAEAA
ncbi:MAG TPA: DmsC/YnfH family molybdoenzyme membrane anchor subunit [Terracidiphilus sp.]|nr:DmsC/YnfH family molybdoenzyme membrane anchor subunit [Terracidiphilus sp.]